MIWLIHWILYKLRRKGFPRLEIRVTVDGKRHKANGPAIMWSDGTQFWYLNDWQHRYYGPANTISGSWYLHGDYVRTI